MKSLKLIQVVIVCALSGCESSSRVSVGRSQTDSSNRYSNLTYDEIEILVRGLDDRRRAVNEKTGKTWEAMYKECRDVWYQGLGTEREWQLTTHGRLMSTMETSPCDWSFDTASKAESLIYRAGTEYQITIERRDGGWHIIKPFREQITAQKIDRLVSQLKTAKIAEALRECRK